MKSLKLWFSVLITLALLCSAAPRVSYGSTPLPDSTQIYTIAEDNRTYGLYVTKGQHPQKMATITVPTTNAYEVVAKVSPDGKYVAVIPDFDSRFGTRIQVLRVPDGKEMASWEGNVSGFVWDGGSKSVAVVHLDRIDSVFDFRPTGVPLTAEVNAEGRPIGKLSIMGLDGSIRSVPVTASISRVLGFAADNQTLYVTREQLTGGFPLEAFAHVRIGSGAIQDVIANPLDGTFYVGFKLVPTSSGEPLVGYVTTTSASAKPRVEERLSLADIDGKNRRDLLTTKEGYADFVWSKDGKQVAFIDANGIWLAPETGVSPVQLAESPSADWKLDSIDNSGQVVASSAVSGLVPLSRGTERKRLPHKGQEQTMSIMAATTANNYAPYIHQVYDTATNFLNGFIDKEQFTGGKQDACGPTSSITVMSALGRYGAKWIDIIPADFRPLGNAWDTSVGPHSHPWGSYVSQAYTATFMDHTGLPRSVNFNIWDYASTGQGAHGYMVKSKIGTEFVNMESFFSVQEIGFVKNDAPTQAWLKTQIDQGRLVIASMKYITKRGGHLSVIKGYETDSSGTITSWILHDTYGNAYNKDWGFYDGANVRYPWSFMGVGTLWSIYLAY